MQPDVCGSETTNRPCSYEAVIEEAPQVQSTLEAPAEDPQAAIATIVPMIKTSLLARRERGR